MKKLLHLFMLSCGSATELIEKKLITPLGFIENMQLKMHKTICNACTAYEKQSKKIDEVLNNHIQSKGIDQIEIIKNDNLKDKIIKKIF